MINLVSLAANTLPGHACLPIPKCIMVLLVDTTLDDRRVSVIMLEKISGAKQAKQSVSAKLQSIRNA